MKWTRWILRSAVALLVALPGRAAAPTSATATNSLRVVVTLADLGQLHGIQGQPQDLAVDPAGNLFIADAFPAARPSDQVCQVRERVAATGAMRIVVGAALTGHSATTPAQRFVPSACWSIGVDGRDNVYVVTSRFPWGYHPLRLYRFNAVHGTVRAIAGCGRCRGFHAGQPGSHSSIWPSDDLLVNRAGDVVVADGTGGSLWKVMAHGDIVRQLARDVCLKPQWVPHSCPRLLASNGSVIHFTDSRERVEAFSLRIRRTHVVAGGGRCASREQAFCGDGIPAVHAKLDGPQDIAADAGGTLYIADTVVQRVNPYSKLITVIAGNGTLPSRRARVYRGERLDARRLPLEPIALATGPAGGLYIADGNIGVLRWRNGNG
jgi:hypothetical protein